MVVEEPPLSRAQLVTAKVSRGLLFFLCAAPIALFPLALAHRVFVHLAQ